MKNYPPPDFDWDSVLPSSDNESESDLEIELEWLTNLQLKPNNNPNLSQVETQLSGGQTQPIKDKPVVKFVKSEYIDYNQWLPFNEYDTECRLSDIKRIDQEIRAKLDIMSNNRKGSVPHLLPLFEHLKSVVDLCFIDYLEFEHFYPAASERQLPMKYLQNNIKDAKMYDSIFEQISDLPGSPEII